jgi:hypothetical protein
MGPNRFAWLQVAPLQRKSLPAFGLSFALPGDETVFTLYGSLSANPVSRASASAIVLLTGCGSEKFPMFSLATVSIAADGTVRVTRVVPVPITISPEAQEELRTTKPSPDSHQTFAEHRAYIQKWQAELGESAITGESAPVMCEAQGVRSRVFADTLVVSGQIVVQITSGPEQVSLITTN